MKSNIAPSLWWVRRDLRLIDNHALRATLSYGKPVIPVFILDPKLTEGKSNRRLGFLFQALHSLRSELNGLGSGLVIRMGNPLQELARLIRETGAEKIFAEKDHTPFAKQRDSEISKVLPLNLEIGQLVVEPEDGLKADGTPYTIFTPFSKKWRSIVSFPPMVFPAPESFPPLNLPKSDPLPEIPNLSAFVASGVEARTRLESFTQDKIFRYAEDRNRLDRNGTSILSPYLRFGLVSHRQAASAAMKAIRQMWQTQPENYPVGAENGPETWLNELIWREFYIHILAHFPQVLNQEFDQRYRKIKWRQDEEDLLAWKEGKTGLPVVDAAMRQLAQTGWMHNRARMITASFLVKDLLIDWREGERWFAEQLIDADLASNNGGWQWTAGTGTDAAPYFRIFNSVLQGQKFDPNGDYVRQWVPELSGFPAGLIHKPWQADIDQQRSAQCLLGRDYPFPIVEREFARQRALHAYKSAKENL